MSSKARILILIGLEGPELQDRLNDNKLSWHSMATDPLWRSLVKRGVTDFLLKAQDEWRWDAAQAEVAVFRDAHELVKVLGVNKYDQVVVCSHGDQWALMPVLAKPGSYVRDYTLAKSFAEAGVKTALFLGCQSKGLAERAAHIAEGVVRFGGIQPIRDDYADKKRLDILNTIVWGYGGRQ